MKYVNISTSQHLGKTITGEFPLVSEKQNALGSKTEMVLRIISGGKEINVHCNKADYTVTEVQDKEPQMTPQMKALDAHIARQFDVMKKLTEFAIAGHLRSVIMSGAAGIGKSYELEKRLDKAIDNDEIEAFTILKGKISGIALFAKLFEHREEGNVLVLDDIDVIFADETSLNLLKAALDSGSTRRLSWLSASTWLQENGIDSEFDFNGTVIFITNLDFDRLIEKNSQLTPHFKALISRTVYLNLGIHTNEEILVRIKQVVNNTPMLDIHGIVGEEKTNMMAWLEVNYMNLREISLRTILKLAAFMKGDPHGWQDIAEATMLRQANFAGLNAMLAAPAPYVNSGAADDIPM